MAVWAALVWGLVWLIVVFGHRAVAGVGIDVVGLVWLGLVLVLEWVLLMLVRALVWLFDGLWRCSW